MMTSIPTPPALLLGIIGMPLGHTMSPALHTWAASATSTPAAYFAWPVDSSDLPAFIRSVRLLRIAGVSVTIPHKRSVMPLLDGCSELALAVGAVNTLHWQGGRLLGENTDVTGFVAPLAALPVRPGSALVLGAGGAARGAVVGLRSLGVERIAVSNRSAGKAEELARDLGVGVVGWEGRAGEDAELIVNATSLGMSGAGVADSPWPGGAFHRGQVAYDLVYNPVETVFLRQAAARGARVIPGLEMFLHQAAAQFRLWTGRDFPLEEGRAILAGLLPRPVAGS